MVFDECHHARKNHPYNSIMRVYASTKESNRPKVFGMTASPIWNPKDPAGSLKELETNLDARTISVLENMDELALHSPKPVEVLCITYPHSNFNLHRRFKSTTSPPSNTTILTLLFGLVSAYSPTFLSEMATLLGLK